MRHLRRWQQPLSYGMTPCSPVETYRYFRLTYFLHFQGGGKVKNLKIRTALLFSTWLQGFTSWGRRSCTLKNVVVLHGCASEIGNPKIIILFRPFSVPLKMQASVRSSMRPTSSVRSFHPSHCAQAQVPVLLCVTNLVIPWRRVIPETLTGPRLNKKFPVFYGTRRYLSTFTTARHLSWARSM